MIPGSGICNLTASAARLRLGEGAGAPDAFSRDGMSAEIIAPERDAPFETGSTERDIIYVVIAGSGVVQTADEEVEFTTGDVVFVPAGVDRHLVRSSQRFKAWKLQLRPR